jgi:nucleotide-binding universal stress UspA family protein
MAVVAAISDEGRKEPVVREAQQLAERLGEELYIVTVMETSDFTELERTSVESTGEGLKMKEVDEMAKAFATDIAEQFIEDDFEYKVRGFVGDPIDELNRFAEDQDVDYLVIGGRKRTRIGKLIFGSTAQSILLNYDRPIVSVKVD